MCIRKNKCALGLLLGLAAAAGSSPSGAVNPRARDAALDAVLQREAQQYMDTFRRRRGSSTDVTIRSWADLEDSLIYMDLGAGALPEQDDGSNEQLEQELGSLLLHYAYLAGMPPHTQIRAMYQGQPYNFYFPYVPGSWGPDAARATRQAGGLAVVSSSHGQYLHHPGQEWRYQRPLLNDVREDLLTPAFGDALQELIEQRSEMTVTRVRSRDLAEHEASGEPWWKIAARYHLKALYPEQTAIWNSLPGSTANDREMLEDIRARPLFANFIQADGLISVHTNGSDNPAVRGVEAYYHRDKPEDRPLADSILCYMKELVRSQAGYEEFPFRGDARPGGHGENRIGVMPSVIVEVAYHSSPEDALALQDPAFRDAAMKGVEKGFRLFRQGAACQPFEAENIEDVDLEDGGSATTLAPFKGYPQFPISLRVRALRCPAGWRCTGGTRQIDEPTEEPIPITASCRNQTGRDGQITWEIALTDSDGVAAGERTFNAMCRARPSPASAHHQMPSASAG